MTSPAQEGASGAVTGSRFVGYVVRFFLFGFNFFGSGGIASMRRKTSSAFGAGLDFSRRFISTPAPSA